MKFDLACLKPKSKMSDSDSEYDSIPKKRKIEEISIPNGLLKGPVKHKKN